MDTVTGARRALGVVRLSVGRGGQTGDATQRKRIGKRADADDCTLVGWAEDIDVSASLSPWHRPKLGEWLNTKADDFDVLYVFKVDRIARSVKDLSDLIEWCDKHGKSLVSIEEGFDLSTTWGRMVAKILAVLAEAELESIKARIRASREAMRESGRWPGGLVPFGRVAVKDGDGFTLGIDPVYGPVLDEMIRLFMACRSFAVVADWLNAGEVPTTQDVARIRSAKGESTTRLNEEKAKPRGRKWSTSAVKSILSSRSLLGEYQRADGTVVRNPDGTPVMRSVPVLTEPEFLRLQEVIAEVSYSKPRSEGRSPMLGVLFCNGCGYPLYYVKPGKNGSRARFRCQGNKARGIPACKGFSFVAPELYQMVADSLISTIGDWPVMEEVTADTDTTSVQLAVLDARLQQLGKEFSSGRMGAAEYASLVAETAAEREELANAPKAAPVAVKRLVRVHSEECSAPETGAVCDCPALTYRQWWAAADVQERREKLVKWGVKAKAAPHEVHIELGHLEKVTTDDDVACESLWRLGLRP